MNFRELWSLTRDTFKEWNEDKAPRLAAALSYYTIFSLAPLLVLVLTIAGLVVGSRQDLRGQLLSQVQSMVGPQGVQVVNTLIDNASQPKNSIPATIFGVITLLLGATGLFGQLQDALNTIWEVTPKKGRGITAILKDRSMSFIMVLGLSLLLLASIVISAALGFVNRSIAGVSSSAGMITQVLYVIISLVIMTVAFALIFRFLPDVKIKWSDVLLGAFVTAVLFTIGKQLIALYLSSGTAASTFGAAASLIILLLWVYYSAQILFIGAEFTQVYTRRHSAVPIAENARPVTEAERAQEGAVRDGPAAEHIQQAILPITGDLAIHPRGQARAPRERVRYEAPNPNVVIPVIAGGALAGAFTLGRVAQKAISSARRRSALRR